MQLFHEHGPELPPRYFPVSDELAMDHGQDTLEIICPLLRVSAIFANDSLIGREQPQVPILSNAGAGARQVSLATDDLALCVAKHLENLRVLAADDEAKPSSIDRRMWNSDVGCPG